MGEKQQIAISVASLSPPDKDGWLTKQGGSIKTWKRRWFVLKGQNIYYFKTNKDTTLTGCIDLDPESFVKEEPAAKKKKNMFSVGTKKRIFFIAAESPEEMNSWIETIKSAIKPTNQPARTGSPSNTPASPQPTPATTTTTAPATQPAATPTGQPNPAPANGAPVALSSARSRMQAARSVVPFLQDEESKVLEFWVIWTESMPSDANNAGAIEFKVATSADMQKLQWRVAGPQNVFIQKMVDFFWNVGAPETEIDRLNDVGALINPVKIGSWIDMSAKGGMDGGWYFPVEIALKLAIEASDAGMPTQKVTEWAENNGIVNCSSVGRDMGAAPPRQTELRIKLPGVDFQNQLRIAVDAFFMFGFPSIPEEALRILRDNETEGLFLSIITSSEGFVRLGLLVPSPPKPLVQALYGYAGSNQAQMAAFEAALGGRGPAWVEYQYLMKGFGYGVYKEGFDVVFHWNVGEE